jgi:hypothetical protein
VGIAALAAVLRERVGISWLVVRMAHFAPFDSTGLRRTFELRIKDQAV